jgi:excisionase family DNA binding protein
MADDDILTVAQVAAQFHVTPQTVRSWIDSGKLKGGRVGKAYVILRRDVYAMVDRAARERQHGERAAWADERESELPPAAGGSSGPGALWAGAGTATALVPPRSG